MLKYDATGLIPAVVQDAATRQVLMVGYMNQESVRRTVETGQAWFWSRSRGELWHKGATSGNYLNVRALRVDCDGDTLLLEAEPAGPTCHTGAVSCFFNELEAADVRPAGRTASAAAATPSASGGEGAARADAAPRPEGGLAGGEDTAPGNGGGGALDGRTVEALFAVIQERQQVRPEGSYVAKLLDAGVDRIAKKIGEEATEVVIAAKNADHGELTWEVADLWFHSLVLLAASGLTPADIWQELDRRRK